MGGMNRQGGVRNQGARPANIPSGDDDDVIAAQIREAAENEADPVLRERLWEEYISYKNSVGSGE